MEKNQTASDLILLLYQKIDKMAWVGFNMTERYYYTIINEKYQINVSESSISVGLLPNDNNKLILLYEPADKQDLHILSMILNDINKRYKDRQVRELTDLIETVKMLYK